MKRYGNSSPAPISLTAEPDQGVIAVQIGRELRAHSEVVARCPLGLPVVIAVPPVLDDGTPFPTRFWLSCPLAVLRIARLESAGGVHEMDTRVESDPTLAAALEAAHARYRRERDALVGGGVIHRPSGGVAGAVRGVKCLHAHYADHAAGNDNPVGALVAPSIEPLDCTIPCVVDNERNRGWREPSVGSGTPPSSGLEPVVPPPGPR
ncbi:MAG: DUF501 domain-containing protein [Acidimicrobiia bacterium]|nr:DUF501 domain-containing protein [Acidimicrobiia bacterium]